MNTKQQLACSIVALNASYVCMMTRKHEAKIKAGFASVQDFIQTFCDQDTEAYKRDLVKLLEKKEQAIW